MNGAIVVNNCDALNSDSVAISKKLREKNISSFIKYINGGVHISMFPTVLYADL